MKAWMQINVNNISMHTLTGDLEVVSIADHKIKLSVNQQNLQSLLERLKYIEPLFTEENIQLVLEFEKKEE